MHVICKEWAQECRIVRAPYVQAGRGVLPQTISRMRLAGNAISGNVGVNLAH